MIETFLQVIIWTIITIVVTLTAITVLVMIASASFINWVIRLWQRKQ